MPPARLPLRAAAADLDDSMRDSFQQPAHIKTLGRLRQESDAAAIAPPSPRSASIATRPAAASIACFPPPPPPANGFAAKPKARDP
eukprot:2403940-Prymnesium_polylepis.1